MYKICILQNNSDGIWVHTAKQGALVFRFSSNPCDVCIWKLIAWNFTQFCMQRTYLINTIFVNKACQGATIITTIFPEHLRKCKSRVLLNEIERKFIRKIHIVTSNNYVLQMYIQGNVIIFQYTPDNRISVAWNLKKNMWDIKSMYLIYVEECFLMATTYQLKNVSFIL